MRLGSDMIDDDEQPGSINSMSIELAVYPLEPVNMSTIMRYSSSTAASVIIPCS